MVFMFQVTPAFGRFVHQFQDFLIVNTEGASKIHEYIKKEHWKTAITICSNFHKHRLQQTCVPTKCDSKGVHAS